MQIKAQFFGTNLHKILAMQKFANFLAQFCSVNKGVIHSPNFSANICRNFCVAKNGQIVARKKTRIINAYVLVNSDNQLI